jgi:protein-S-isoprenylcysteine O-methyltransferase Ste14
MRALYAAFGLVCYGAFLATIAYGVGFVGNYWAVFGWQSAWLRSLDDGAPAPLGEAIAMDLALVALFGVQHSVMARRGFKRWSARVVPAEIERSIYVLASSVCLGGLLLHWRPIGFRLWDASGSALGWAIVGVALVGWLVAASSTFLIDHAAMFGLRQSFRAARDEPEQANDFGTPGLYRAVRHPLYFGFLLAFWASPVMTLGHLVFAVGLTAYVLVAIPLEERDLVALYGQKYRDYRKQVRALLPFPRSK